MPRWCRIGTTLIGNLQPAAQNALLRDGGSTKCTWAHAMSQMFFLELFPQCGLPTLAVLPDPSPIKKSLGGLTEPKEAVRHVPLPDEDLMRHG
mgnify:CR=1 FL=1